MRELFAQGLDDILEAIGESVTIATPFTSFTIKALVEDGLNEFGMEEIFLTIPYGEWFDAHAASKSDTTVTVRGIAYKIIDARDIIGAYEVRLERAQ